MSNDTEWISLLKNYVARKRMFYNFVSFCRLLFVLLRGLSKTRRDRRRDTCYRLPIDVVSEARLNCRRAAAVGNCSDCTPACGSRFVGAGPPASEHGGTAVATGSGRQVVSGDLGSQISGDRE